MLEGRKASNFGKVGDKVTDGTVPDDGYYLKLDTKNLALVQLDVKSY